MNKWFCVAGLLLLTLSVTTRGESGFFNYKDGHRLPYTDNAINVYSTVNGDVDVASGNFIALPDGTKIGIHDGAIDISCSNCGGGGGGVSSVGLSLPNIFSVSGSPVTDSGTLTGSLATQTANTVFSGPTTGAAAAPTFRALVSADIPSLDTSKITTGLLPLARGGTNAAITPVAGQIAYSTSSAIALMSGGSNGDILFKGISAPTWGTPGSLTSSNAAITVGNGSSVLLSDASISIRNATTLLSGILTATDWNTFNNKESALTFSSPLSRSTNTISIPAATTSVNGYLTSTDWNTFNGKAAHVLPSFTQMVYVNYQNGSDATGDGSWDKPFKTIAFALTTISDSSSDKPYVVGLTGARQVETVDILMKPYTSIIGMGQRATYIRDPGHAIKPDASMTANSWNVIKNIYLGGGTPLNWDLQAIGGNNCELILENVTLGSTFTYKGRNAGGGDFLEAYVGIIFGPIVFDSVHAQMQSLEIPGTVTLTNTQAIGMDGTWNNIVFDDNVSFTSAGSQFMNNVAYDGGITFTTVGTNTLDSYRGLPPKAQRTFSGGTTVTNRDDSTMLPYVPTTSSNWSSVPTDVGGALDFLATGALKTAIINGASTATNAVLIFKDGHIKSTRTTAPTAAPTANAGTGASCSLANATDTAGSVTLVTTAVASSSGDECDITFNKTYGVAPICVLTPSNSTAILDAVIQGIYFTTTTSTIAINFANADSTGRTYTWSYHCVETQ